MKTTTTYTQTVTIVTEDDGARTITRSHHADTNSVFWFEELSEEAQARAVRDAISEELEAYYNSGWPYASMTGASVNEVWEAFHDLQKRQPLQYHDHYSSFYLTVGDAESISTEQDDGTTPSIDICSAWNRYARAIEMLIEEAEDHEATAAELSAPYYWYAPSLTSYEEPESASIWYDAHSDHADKCRQKAEELADDAANAVESAIKTAVDSIEDYYRSPEFWRDWYANGDERFTRDGERI